MVYRRSRGDHAPGAKEINGPKPTSIVVVAEKRPKPKPTWVVVAMEKHAKSEPTKADEQAEPEPKIIAAQHGPSVPAVLLGKAEVPPHGLVAPTVPVRKIAQRVKAKAASPQGVRSASKKAHPAQPAFDMESAIEEATRGVSRILERVPDEKRNPFLDEMIHTLEYMKH